MHVETIKTESLGNRGYLVHDGEKAVAIDVQRDYGRWLEAAKKAGVEIVAVLETHIHNDYVSGGFRLSRDQKANYVIPTQSNQSFEAKEVGDGDEVEVGGLKITALHTPGHTPNHISYRISDGQNHAVFTGGGLLYGTVGRPDLISEDMTEELANAQYDSAQKLLKELPENTSVYPTHGFGSFCSSAEGTGADKSTIKEERQANIAFTSKSKESFVEEIIAGLSAYPKYYAHMGVTNQSGPGDMRLKDITSLSREQIAAMLSHDDWVVDIRSRYDFASQHPKGAAGFEYSASLATYIGWLIPWGDMVTLVGDSGDKLEDAQLQLGRIGMDQFVAAASNDTESYLVAGESSSYELKEFKDLEPEQDNVLILDVRDKKERGEVYIKNSVNIPLHELNDRLHELPSDKNIWVHCQSGYRASIAASLIDRTERDVVLIDDNFDNVKREMCDE